MTETELIYAASQNDTHITLIDHKHHIGMVQLYLGNYLYGVIALT